MNLHDVNIYVNAFNRDSPRHSLCFETLRSAAEGKRNFAYSPLALSGFMRIVTHPKILSHPTTSDSALDFIEALTESPNAVPVLPSRTHMLLFNHLCRRYCLSGNDIPDAFFAALAMESDCTWVTMDRGFSRYADLRVQILA